MEPLPLSKESKLIFVMIDRLTDYIKMELILSMATVQDIVRLIYLSWYYQFELLKADTSDDDKLFTS